MAKEIPKYIDEITIHMTFEDANAWAALDRMDFDTTFMAFKGWFGDNEEAQSKLKNAGKMILINDANGDASVKVHPNYVIYGESKTGRCKSIW